MADATALDLDTIDLGHGSHTEPFDDKGVFQGCWAEAASYIAGEPWSDHPDCVSPVLGAYGRSLNDRLDHEQRQLLKPFIRPALGTANDGLDERRRLILANHAYRTLAPKWFRRAGLDEHATVFEQLPEFTSMDDVRRARAATVEARDAAWAKRRSRYDEIRARVHELLKSKPDVVADADAGAGNRYSKAYVAAKKAYLAKIAADPTVSQWRDESVRDAVELFDRLTTADA